MDDTHIKDTNTLDDEYSEDANFMDEDFTEDISTLDVEYTEDITNMDEEFTEVISFPGDTDEQALLTSDSDNDAYDAWDEDAVGAFLEEVLHSDDMDPKEKRRKAVLLGALGLFVIITVVVIFSTGLFGTMTNSNSNVPIATPINNTSSTSNANSSSSTNSSTSTNNPSNNTTDDTSNASTPIPVDQGNDEEPWQYDEEPSLTWYPPRSEQVWVNTSGWQSVYVGENPIFQQAEICSTCGASSFGGIWDHINNAHGGLGGFYIGSIQVGTEPIYETRWVESGYWTTVTRPGYWG